MAGGGKREGYLEWDEYFMGVAFLAAQRSKDPSTQVGACIVNDERKIVGVGYNGFPIGCSDDVLPWSKTAADRKDTKYPYVCHAELNAIINKNSSDVRGCDMYVTLFPCNDCAKLAIQAGIARFVFLSDKHHDKPEMVASRRLLDMVGIGYERFVPRRKSIVVDFESGAREEMERSMLIGSRNHSLDDTPENDDDDDKNKNNNNNNNDYDEAEADDEVAAAVDAAAANGDSRKRGGGSETESERRKRGPPAAREAFVLNAKILAHAQVAGEASVEDVVVATGESEAVVRRSLEFLVDEGLLEDGGGGRLQARLGFRTSTPVKA